MASPTLKDLIEGVAALTERLTTLEAKVDSREERLRRLEALVGKTAPFRPGDRPEGIG